MFLVLFTKTVNKNQLVCWFCISHFPSHELLIIFSLPVLLRREVIEKLGGHLANSQDQPTTRVLSHLTLFATELAASELIWALLSVSGEKQDPRGSFILS